MRKITIATIVFLVLVANVMVLVAEASAREDESARSRYYKSYFWLG